MNKDEILKRAQCTQGKKDEREEFIEKAGNESAFMVIMTVNALLVVILFFQKLFTGKHFADPDTFFLAFLLGWLGKHATKYHYEKKKEDLCIVIMMVFGSICCLGNIIGKGMGWF